MWEYTLFQTQLWSLFLYTLTPMNKNDRNVGKCHLGTDNSPLMTNPEHCRTAHLQTKQNQDLSSLCNIKTLISARSELVTCPVTIIYLCCHALLTRHATSTELWASQKQKFVIKTRPTNHLPGALMPPEEGAPNFSLNMLFSTPTDSPLWAQHFIKSNDL